MTGDIIGYVVIEWAGGPPRVGTYSGYGGDIYDTRAEADEILACTRSEMESVGRGTGYALAEVRVIEETRSDCGRGGA